MTSLKRIPTAVMVLFLALQPMRSVRVAADAGDARVPSAVAPTNAQNVELVGQIGGVTHAVALQGDYAYIGVGPRLVVLSVSDPAQPSVVGRSEVMSDTVRAVAVADGYAYVAAGRSGLRIVDVSDPGNPTEVGHHDTTGTLRCVAVADGYAYVAPGSFLWGGGLDVVDVSDPTEPVRVGQSSTPSDTEDLVVTGRYLYVADDYYGLRIIDVSDPANPTQVGHYDTPGIHGVEVVGHHAYLADHDGGEGGLRIVDVSDPANPTQVAYRSFGGYPSDVTVAGDYAYLVTDSGGLSIVDVSDVAHPTRVGLTHTSGEPKTVVVAGHHVYVAADDGGLRIVDVSDPSNPIGVGHYDILAHSRGVAVAGHHVYVADYDSGLYIVDVSDPAQPTQVGHWDTSRYSRAVAVAGGYAHVADFVGGLRIVDVADPANPTEVGYCDTVRYPLDVAVAGGYAYVGSNGLHIVDISDPARPTEVGHVWDSGVYYGSAGVAVVGSYAYVTGDGLGIVDVSDPANATQMGHCETPGDGVAVAGGHAYVTGGSGGGLWIADVSDPAHPIEVGHYDTLESSHGVALGDGYAWVANERSGVRIVDVSDPAHPTEVGRYDTTGHSYDVAVAGNYAYVADGSGGLWIFRFKGGEPGDSTPPAAITNLSASTGVVSGTVDLSWPAPGDDGSVGTASTYAVRYNTVEITDANWGSSTDVTGEPPPSSAGSTESMTVPGLTPGQTYHFAIKTLDEVPNTSDISNSPGAVAAPSSGSVVSGRITLQNPDGEGLVALREMQVDLVYNGAAIAATTTKGGDGQDAGTYSFRLTSADSGNYRVRATLKQPPNPTQGVGGFEVKYMPPLLSDPVPWVETPGFSLQEDVVVQNLDFSSTYVTSGGSTNLSSSARQYLDDLASIYYHVHQAEHFAIEQLGVTSLGYVEVHAFDSNLYKATYYQANDNTIVIAQDNSEVTSWNRPENREWHEYFHHLMAETNLIALSMERSCGNHEGFLNTTTSDSWAEGWAIFLAEALSEYLGYNHVGWYVDWYYLNTNYQSWDTEQGSNDEVLQREDFAVASLLWDLHDAEEDDAADLDDDHLTLPITQMRNVLLQKESGGTYAQLSTLLDVYAVLIDEYPVSDVKEIFESHGFFGDRGWTVESCNISSQGDKQWEAGEPLGEGGREGRSDLPHVEGANLLVNLQTRQGLPAESGLLVVRYKYPPPYDVFDTAIERKAYNGSLFHLQLPPSRIPMTVEVQGDDPQSAVYISTNSDYWSAVAGSGRDYVVESTFTVEHARVYLPLVLRS